MKKTNWIRTIVFIASLVLIACQKDKISIECPITHWPVVKTLETTNFTSTTATLKGAVNGFGLSTRVIFEYGTSESYGDSVIAIQSPVNEDNLTYVSADISGLTPCAYYHFRLKAENSKWINFYGADKTFTKKIVTAPVTNITSYAGISGGNILAECGDSVTARGVCYATSQNPTIANSISEPDYSPEGGSGTGSFTNWISGLTANTIYYVRAYATTSSGTIYGDQQSFTSTPVPIVFNPSLNYGTVSDIDGNSYKTIQIGTQVWMAENLRTTHYPNGTAIQLIPAQAWSYNGFTSGWDALGLWGKAFCWPWDDFTNASVYGALYTWGAAMNGADSSSSSPSGVQGVCPTGWHLPSDDEWTTLITYLGGDNIAGGKAKETGTIHWQDPNEGATNESGFTAIPSGAARDGITMTMSGYWWSSTIIPTYHMPPSHEVDYNQVAYRYLFSNGPSFKHFITGPCSGFSVRCVKN